MAKLFLFFWLFFSVLLSPLSALASSRLCPAPVASPVAIGVMPDSEVLHQAMQNAKQSGQQLDWVNDKHANACGGYYLEPDNPSTEQALSVEQAQSYLSADAIEQSADGAMQLSGHVELYQGARRLSCQQLLFNPNTGIKQLSGDIQIRQNGLLLTADKAQINEQLQQSELSHARYLLHQQMLRGQAETIRTSNNHGLLIELKKASFSTCPEDNEVWSFQAKAIELDKEKGWGTLHSAVLKIKNVPVAYIPYLNFPIDDRRKTGVLWPSIGLGSDYLDFALPIYFNLAPDYDLTYTPRLLSQHGLMHNLELRYKQRYSDWQFGGSFIPNDRRVNEVKVSDDPTLDKKRWLGFIKQQGQFNANWSSYINYQAVSDTDYFRDWGTKGLDVQKSLNIERNAGINFNSQHWAIGAKIVDYETLELDPATGRRKTEEYRLWPQIDVHYLNNLRHLTVEPLLDAQYSYFDHDSLLVGQRLYLAPGLSLPLRFKALDIIPKLRLKTISYALDSDNQASQAPAGGYYHNTHSVQVPTFSLDSKLYFERQNGDSSSTLTPRLFYYYAHYKNQDALPNFDTQLMDFSYQQLWRDNRFAGLDRIENANQVSLGLENSWSLQGRAVFDMGIGQSFYFADRKVSPLASDRQYQVINASDSAALKKQKQQINRQIDKLYYRRSSDIAAQANWYINQQQSLNSQLIYDPYAKRVSEAAVGYHYQDAQQRIFNLAYRYQFQPLVVFNQQAYRQSVDQISGSFYLPVSPQWTLYHSSRYDINQRRYISSVSGFQYGGCCFTIMLAHKRERRSFDNDVRVSAPDPVRYRNYWFIQFELKGLGGVTQTISRLLEETIQGYH